MAKHPFEPFGSEFTRAMEELGTRLTNEMKRVQQELGAAIERVAAEVQRAMEEFEREQDDTARWDKRPKKGQRAYPTSPGPERTAGKKRPRRRPPGSAPAPVKPKPKPTPLMDGAEAPIE